jgi:hypothetical protein
VENECEFEECFEVGRTKTGGGRRKISVIEQGLMPSDPPQNNRQANTPLPRRMLAGIQRQKKKRPLFILIFLIG